MVTSVSSSIRPDKIISLQDAHFSDGDPAVGSADGHGSMSAGWTVNIATLAGCRVDPLDDAIAKGRGNPARQVALSHPNNRLGKSLNCVVRRGFDRRGESSLRLHLRAYSDYWDICR
jgi:hypothetical protein